MSTKSEQNNWRLSNKTYTKTAASDKNSANKDAIENALWRVTVVAKGGDYKAAAPSSEGRGRVYNISRGQTYGNIDLRYI